MKKNMLYSLFSIVIVVLVISIVVLSNPLRKSPKNIKADILKLTPIGMSMEDAIKVIDSNEKWAIRYISGKYGYSMFGGWPGAPSPNEIAQNADTIIGEKSINASIGEYRNIYKIYVDVFWGFDENSKLISITVRKDGDVL